MHHNKCDSKQVNRCSFHGPLYIDFLGYLVFFVHNSLCWEHLSALMFVFLGGWLDWGGPVICSLCLVVLVSIFALFCCFCLLLIFPESLTRGIFLEDKRMLVGESSGICSPRGSSIVLPSFLIYPFPPTKRFYLSWEEVFCWPSTLVLQIGISPSIFVPSLPLCCIPVLGILFEIEVLWISLPSSLFLDVPLSIIDN